MSTETNVNRKLSTFWIAGRLYGIDVMKVQEITKALPMARVPLAPKYVHGLINLRGQISTAVGLRELFNIQDAPPIEQMNVVCRIGDLLVSFLIDKIGDVMELSQKDFEAAPETIPDDIRLFIEGVYKIPNSILSVIDIDRVAETFFKSTSHSLQPQNKPITNIKSL